MAPTANGNAVSSTERIKELNEIDQDVVKLLRCAGSALESLTKVGGSAGNSGQSNSIETQKEVFTAASSEYLKLLSSIDVRLRHQINALREAEIIPAEAVTRDSQNSQPVSSAPSIMGGPAPLAKKTGSSRSVITGGGLGNLDVGWLNSRNDHIGKGMEAGLWEEAQRFVEELIKEQTDSGVPAAAADGQSVEEAISRIERQDQDSQMDQS